MSEVTITIKDVIEGEDKGVTFDYSIEDDDINSLAVYIAGELAVRAIEILEGDFADPTDNKVH
tara:strand:- start:353 stop:541 length:189 start_codon:yes stop_codon:yes gene_type:complete